MHTRQCEICDCEFDPADSDSGDPRFCSADCRQDMEDRVAGFEFQLDDDHSMDF